MIESSSFPPSCCDVYDPVLPTGLFAAPLDGLIEDLLTEDVLLWNKMASKLTAEVPSSPFDLSTLDLAIFERILFSLTFPPDIFVKLGCVESTESWAPPFFYWRDGSVLRSTFPEIIADNLL